MTRCSGPRRCAARSSRAVHPAADPVRPGPPAARPGERCQRTLQPEPQPRGGHRHRPHRHGDVQPQRDPFGRHSRTDHGVIRRPPPPCSTCRRPICRTRRPAGIDVDHRCDRRTKSRHGHQRRLDHAGGNHRTRPAAAAGHGPNSTDFRNVAAHPERECRVNLAFRRPSLTVRPGENFGAPGCRGPLTGNSVNQSRPGPRPWTAGISPRNS